MSIGLIGKKIGMTRVFSDDGEAIAVTVIDVSDNIFLQRKTTETDGYSSVQVAFDGQKESRLNQAATGHIKAYGGSAKKITKEFRVDSDEQVPVGVDHPGIDLFDEGQWVDVIGTTKGKGFQGVVKRYHFHGQPAAHGHMMHRRPGGVGAGTDPGRIWKNKKMPGQHGNYNRTIQNLKIIRKRNEDDVLLISGAIPGANGGYVVIRPAVKKDQPEQDFKAIADAKVQAAAEAAEAVKVAAEEAKAAAAAEVEVAGDAASEEVDVSTGTAAPAEAKVDTSAEKKKES